MLPPRDSPTCSRTSSSTCTFSASEVADAALTTLTTLLKFLFLEEEEGEEEEVAAESEGNRETLGFGAHFTRTEWWLDDV